MPITIALHLATLNHKETQDYGLSALVVAKVSGQFL